MEITKIRNFCIIAHIDHGKSTLADRILEYTNTISAREMKSQVLDFLDIERERNITIKLSSVRIKYNSPGRGEYKFNLIDTPGHVDFTYEVSRSIAACEGALLIVDAAQGIQAQTLSNAYLALEHDLTIIPIINKVDLPNADVEGVKKQLQDILGFDPKNAILISAKTGLNIDKVLEAIIDRIEPPKMLPIEEGVKGIVFDSFYDTYRGAVLFIRLFNGTLKVGDKIKLMASDAIHQITELGIKTNKEIALKELNAGEVGWIAAGIKNISEINVGDTITTLDNPASEPVIGYQELNPMVYCSLFPTSSLKYKDLKTSLVKIALTDASLRFEPESSQALGFGFRCGFLGLLHMEVIHSRLEREYNLALIATAPSVKYQLHLTNGQIKYISNPAYWSPPQTIDHVSEPFVLIKIFTTEDCIGGLMDLCYRKRGVYNDIEYIGGNRRLMTFEIPLNEIIFDFFNKLKSISRGYASYEYDFLEYRQSKLVKVDILLNGEIVDALSVIAHRDFAYRLGRDLCIKLKSLIPRENFEVPIQAVINRKIIARETIKATRKNVTAGLYGGDITRKKKVLARQKKGKKHLKLVGKVRVPQEAFLAILKIEEN